MGIHKIVGFEQKGSKDSEKKKKEKGKLLLFTLFYMSMVSSVGIGIVWAGGLGGNGEIDGNDAASVEGVWTRARRIASVLFGNVKFQVSPALFDTSM